MNQIVSIGNCTDEDLDVAREDYRDSIEYLWEVASDIDPITFVVLAKNVGWRNISGAAVIRPNDAQEFVDGVTGFERPPCYRLDVFKCDNYLDAKLYHHDSPTGESRVIYSVEEWVRNELKGIPLQKLHKFLRSFRQTNGLWYWEGTSRHYYDEEFIDKPVRQYTREDFVYLITSYHYENLMADTELLNLYSNVLKWGVL